MAKFTAIYHSAWGDGRMIDGRWFAKYGSLITDIIHFKVDPIGVAPYFSFNGGEGNHAKNRAQIIADAHARGIRVQLCIGGVEAPTWNVFTRDAALTRTIIRAMGEYCKQHGYDGFNLDWEADPNDTGFRLLSNIMREELDSWTHAHTETGRGILSSAAGRFPNHPTDVLNAQYDQTFVMGYDCNGAWSDGISGFHEPIYDVSKKYLVKEPEKVFYWEEMYRRWSAAGLDWSKAAFGIAFYGRNWGSCNAPGVKVSGDPREGLDNYYSIRERVNSGAWTEHYEPLAEQVWAGGAATGYSNYNNPQTVAAKVKWMKDKGIGGVMLFANEHSTYWETATNPLLDAVAGVIEPPQLSAPVFTLRPLNVTAKKGETVTFTAMAKGNPSPKIKWYRNSGFLGDGNSVSFVATENEVIRCLAYNSEGEAMVDVHLTIEIVDPPASDLEQRVAKLEAFEQEARAFYARVKGVFE